MVQPSTGPAEDGGWFARRTYRAHDFDADDLIRRKQRAGLTVSVVLPALDEADTIVGMVEAVGELSGRLVDELVVVDGGSTDGTAELAAKAGATVHRDSSVLPDHGPPLGKGDALWRGLAVTSGDLVVFADTDIRNPDSHFVWALLGPLLTDPDVQLVKAFYERPVQVGDRLHDSGGGRVTELMARPLLNLLWPELAGLIQPLSGEYAGRRELLESVPFFTGYGVELGLLVDTLAAVGADGVAQVDVYERVHRNQDLAALSRMACGILQVALSRLGERDGVELDIPAALPYLQFDRQPDGRMRPRRSTVELVERPPLASLR